MFYVYEWFLKDSQHIFYVGKGCGNRYKVKNRNEIFNKILEINKANCDVRIIAYFQKEQDAFDFESKRIRELKSQKQAEANKDFGGNGGVVGIWTNEMRKKMSENNPMKDEEQRKRMSINNPMKNKEVAEKVAKTNRKAVIINNQKFVSEKAAADHFKVNPNTICNWVKRGYDTQGNSCYFESEGPKEYFYKKSSSVPVLIDGRYFSSLRDACKFLGVKDTSPLCKALKEHRTYKGHKCEYANQQPSQEKPMKVSQKVQRLER